MSEKGQKNRVLIITGGRIERDFAAAYLREQQFDRVIAADGSWGGYGAGIQRKIFLLELEKAHRDNIR